MLGDDATIGERVAWLVENAQGADREDVRVLLVKVLDAANEQRRVLVRSVGLLVLAAGLFVVLSGGGLTEAEIFGLKIERFTLFLLAIPVAVSFLFLRACAMLNAFRVYKTLYFNCTALFYPALRTSLLDALLLSTPDQVNGPVASIYYRRGLARKAVSATALAEALFLLLAPAGFTVYAFYWLFSSSEISRLGTAVSLFFSLLLLAAGWVQYLISTRSDYY